MNSLDVLSEIYNNSEIEFFLFHHFPKQKLLQNQVNFGDTENIQFEKAMLIRSQYHLPFWDSMMLTYFNRENTSNQILKCALNHNSIEDAFWSNDFTILNSKLNDNIALNSKVKLGTGEERHLPLLDFHIPISNENEKIVLEVIKLLGFLDGYILKSGESYHFIGVSLIDDSELVRLLSKALFFSPIIDRAWIAHQLIERSASLRISYKHCILPTLIHRL